MLLVRSGVRTTIRLIVLPLLMIMLVEQRSVVGLLLLLLLLLPLLFQQRLQERGGSCQAGLFFFRGGNRMAEVVVTFGRRGMCGVVDGGRRGRDTGDCAGRTVLLAV